MEDRMEQAQALIAAARGKPVSGNGVCLVQDEEFRSVHPILAAYLFTPQTNNAGASSVGSLTLFAFDGQVKAVLSDRVTDRSLWASGGTIAEVLSCLEDRLGDDLVDWRQQRPDKLRRK